MKDAFGYWAPQPGSIMENGDIVESRNGPEICRVRYGVVAIKRSRLAIAERFGWRQAVPYDPTTDVAHVTRGPLAFADEAAGHVERL